MRTLLLLLLSQCVLACHRPELSYRKVHCRGIVNVRNDLKVTLYAYEGETGTGASEEILTQKNRTTPPA